jgi:hypothetical protein
VGAVRFVALAAALLFLAVGVPAESFELPIHGFVEAAGGIRLENDPVQPKDATLGEGRVQLEYAHEWEKGPKIFVKADFLGDAIAEELSADLREGYIDYAPAASLELRLGRQILTWGTGDFLFINDVFPKDYISFFIGRQPQYLKLPSDAAKVSLFLAPVALDLVAIPSFTPDNVLTGERLSFFDGLSNRIRGTDAGLILSKPKRIPGNAEVAGRLSAQVGSYELALYGFKGFFKSPLGVKDSARRELFYPELAVYGASVRGPVLEGIGNFEVGYYDSLEDRAGTNPLIENSSVKYLLGYERQLWADFTLGAQYYVEQMLRFRRFETSRSPGGPHRDEFRHLLTLRLTQLFWNQTLELSLFVFYSPSDEDYYLRPAISYKITDQLTAVLGGNIFGGQRASAAFGQLDRNDTVYLRLTYGF